MISLLAPVIAAVLPIYCILIIGGVLRHFGGLKPESDSSLMTLAVHLLLPALILHSMIGVPAMSDLSVVGSAMAVGFGLIVLSTVIAYFVGKGLKFSTGKGLRTFAVASSIPNYSYLAIPLIASLFPNDGAMAVLFVHNMGVELAMWTLSLMLLSGDFRFSVRLFLKGPIVAVVLGLLINFTGAAPHLPSAILEAMRMLGQCALPIALLLIGATLYDLLGKQTFTLKVCAGACGLRLFFLPLIILAVAAFLPLPLALKQVLCVQAALPAAMFTIVMAKHYGGQPTIATQVVLTTTFASLLTMPLIVIFGIWWLELT